MNINYKIYDNVLDDNLISNLCNYTEEKPLREGKVGNRVNINHKKRYDCYITNNSLLRDIDNQIYSVVYNDIKVNFNKDIKFRESWKIGYYKGEEENFYNYHTDDARETKYRCLSMVLGLTDPEEYEGGILHLKDENKFITLQKGQLIVFKSSILHGVSAVTKGNRLVLIGFFFDSEGKKIKEKNNIRLDIKSYIPILKKENIKITYSKEELSNDFSHTAQLGDIDYSDKFSNKLWNENDDWYFEDNSSDTLLVSFAGMGWKDSIPTFIFYNFLKKYKSINKLFLRDITCRYYITGLKNTSKDIESTLSFIRNFAKDPKYKKIIALGCSAGGYAAILYGHLLEFDKVIAFSPQTVLTDTKEFLIEDKYNAPKTCKWLRNLNKDNEFYQNILDLKNLLPFKSSIDIHYSNRANHGSDKKHALYIKSKNCNIIEYSSNNHMIALELRDKGILDKIIENNI